MRYTISTRATRHGVSFSRDELRPIGVTDKSMSLWGVWVEARAIDNRCKYEAVRCSEVQAPHMVIAPIHPNLWPTAFSIEVLVQRREIKAGQNAERSDAIFGLSDALSRFGVNILFVQTAQIGYDLLVYTATCDMPELRDMTRAVLRDADAAAQALALARESLHALPPEKRPGSSEEIAFTKQEGATQSARMNASRALGSKLLPRLSELSAKLTLLDELRYQYAAVTGDQNGLKSSPNSERTKAEHYAKLMALAHTDHFFKLVVGNDADLKDLSPTVRLKRFEASLATSWYFNAKCRVAGENMYFLDYGDYKDRETIRELRALTDSNAGTQPTERDEDELLDILYGQTHQILRDRKPSSFLRSAIRESAIAQRASASRDADQFEASMVKDLVSHLSYVPVRVMPLSLLAHARFWHCVLPGENHGMAEFRYANGMLTPHAAPHREGAMHDTFSYLNSMCELDAAQSARAAPLTTFGPETAVFGTIDQQERCLRLRFELPDRECESFLHVEIEHETLAEDEKANSHSGEKKANSRGLLAETLAFFMRKGLRPERADNVMQEIRVSDDLSQTTLGRHLQPDATTMYSDYREAGTLLITLKAFVHRRSDLSSNAHRSFVEYADALETEKKIWAKEHSRHKLPPEEEAGLELINLISGYVDPCQWLGKTCPAGLARSVRDRIAREIENMWKRQFESVRPGCVRHFRIMLGFVPPRRMGG